jgi:[ribosomal protein S5]-alanine N-acetyltransferase
MPRRVTLRRLTQDDRASFVALARASTSLHHPWVSPPKDPDEFDAFLDRSRTADTRTYVVELVEDGSIVGVFNLNNIVRGRLRSAYLGYYVFEPFSRRGLMGEGLGLVLQEVFVGLQLHRVEANVQPRNASSLALVQRAGFRKEGFSPRYLKIGGRWRDHERWALTEEDWRSARPRR